MKRKLFLILLIFLMIFSSLSMVYGEVVISSGTNMSQKRGYYPSVGLLDNGKIIIIGGRLDDSNDTDTTEIYDPGNDTWTAGPTIQDSNNIADSISWISNLATNAVTLDNGHIMIAGGNTRTDGSWALKIVQILDTSDADPSNWAWGYGPELNEKRMLHQMV